jgi:hypothetical protein
MVACVYTMFQQISAAKIGLVFTEHVCIADD